VKYHLYLLSGTVCWYLKTWLKSRPVTSDLETTVIHSYQLLINDVKPVHSLNVYFSGAHDYILFMLSC